MRHALIGLCIFTAACSSQTPSPSSPSGVVAAAQTQASARQPVEVTFTKWITTFPELAGVTHRGVVGTFEGEVIGRDQFENGTIIQLEAEYKVNADDGARSFVAHIEGTQNNQTRHAVLNGTVIDGWLLGAQVHVTFDVIDAVPEESCVAEAPTNTRCFQGTIRIMPGSAN